MTYLVLGWDRLRPLWSKYHCQHLALSADIKLLVINFRHNSMQEKFKHIPALQHIIIICIIMSHWSVVEIFMLQVGKPCKKRVNFFKICHRRQDLISVFCFLPSVKTLDTNNVIVYALTTNIRRMLTNPLPCLAHFQLRIASFQRNCIFDFSSSWC